MLNAVFWEPFTDSDWAHIIHMISPICHAFISSTFLKHWKDGAEILLEISQYLS